MRVGNFISSSYSIVKYLLLNYSTEKITVYNFHNLLISKYLMFVFKKITIFGYKHQIHTNDL